MGLRSPQEVSPILTHMWDTTGINDSLVNLQISPVMGPSCVQGPQFLGEKTVTIDDIIRINGPRIPSHLNSQKHFNVLTVVLVAYGDAVDTGYVNYMRGLLDTLVVAWDSTTDGRSSLRIDCNLSSVQGKTKPRTVPFSLSYLPREQIIRLVASDIWQGMITVDLVDFRGKIVRNLFRGKSGSNELTLTLRNGGAKLESGTYVLRVKTENSLYSRKLAIIE